MIQFSNVKNENSNGLSLSAKCKNVYDGMFSEGDDIQ